MKDALALALVHFLWQGAVLALVGALLMRVMKIPAVRYAIGVATMFAMLLAPVLTTLTITRAEAGAFVRGGDAGSPAQVRTFSAVESAGAAPSTDLNDQPPVIVPTTWILSLWTIGVMVLSLRFAGGWAVARGLTRQTLRPVGDELQALAADMARRLRVRAAVRVCESASMAVPVMLGCLRPVIILPSAVVTSLPLAQLEALLAHELAHIRRNDYVVNLLQTTVETLCFYHPAVWWISREVRRHREQCCDDVVVQVCDRLTYVTALSAVASFATPQLALSATGGSLRDRVRRLVEPTPTSSSSKGAWIAMLPILLVVALVTPQAWDEQAATPATVAVVTPAEPAAAATAAVEAMPEAQVIESSQAQEARRARAQAEIEQTQRAVIALLERMKAEQGATSERRAADLEKSRRAVNELLERMKDEQGVVSERRAVELEKMKREVDDRLAQRRVEQGLARVANEAQMKEVQRAVEERASARNAELARNIERLREQVGERVEAEVRPERQRMGESAALELQLRELERALARQQQLIDKGLTTRDTAERYEQQITQMKEAIERSRSLSTRIEQLGEERARRVPGLEVGEYRRGLGEVLGASATLQPEDSLTISIEGEPDLPTVFTVRSDGSIRFPFLGSIRVQGSTTAQVQSVIRKLLADRKLVSNPEVTVSAQRRR
jgi:beta-lactamase regulating signal transducer with metallopeptidase domain